MKNSNEWLKSVANNKNSVKMQKKVYHKWLIPEFVIRNVLGAIIVIRDLYIFFTGILSMKYNEQNGILSNAEFCALLLLLATLSLLVSWTHPESTIHKDRTSDARLFNCRVVHNKEGHINMDTTTIICILAIVGIALLAIGSEFDTVSYLLPEAGTIFLIFAIAITVMHFLWVKSEREAYETHVIEKVVESAQNKDMDIYIDGEPVSDELDIKGIDLDKYNIKIEDDILYLISK